MNQPLRLDQISPFGIGSYTAVEAARLLGTSARNVRRWMAGYRYSVDHATRTSPPLWSPEIPLIDDHVEIGFRDLIELRFVKAFVDAGLGLKAIRNCLSYARELVNDQRPFSTRRFQTDGRSIFLESQAAVRGEEVLNLRHRQYEMRAIIARTFRDLDLEDDVVARWRPYRGKASIIIDPLRSFGQPIAAASGIPTVALADAAEAEASIGHVALLFDVPVGVIRDAVAFEKQLRAA